jgi:hypothetical protein
MFEKAIPTANLIENGKRDPQGRPEVGSLASPPWPICSRSSLASSSTCRPHPSPLSLSISSCFSLIFVCHPRNQMRFLVKQSLVALRNKKVVVLLYCATDYTKTHCISRKIALLKRFSSRRYIYI